MILSASYEEISRLLKEKIGQPITLEYKDVDTLTVTYEASFSLPVINRPITAPLKADLKLVEMALPRLVLQLDAGTAGNMALELASKKLLEKLPEGFVEEFSKGRAVLNLAAISEAGGILNLLQVNNLSFYSTSLSLDAEMK